MQQDNIYLDIKDKLIIGIQKVCSLIKSCYGPSGSNVIIQDLLYPYHRVTNDGKLMIDKVKLADPIEQIGANIMKEVGDKADKDSGDGRKTTMILTEAILLESQKVKATPLEIKKSLDECLPIILKNLDEQKQIIKTEDVANVATVACEDITIGKLIGEIYQQIGKNGIIEVDNSGTFETSYEIKDGVRLRNCGLIAPQMATEGNKAVYKKPKILITTQKIGSILDIDTLFRVLVDKDINELVIFCEDISLEVLGALMHPDNRLLMKTLVIRAPKLWKDWIIEDFAKITGATIIDGVSITLKNAEIRFLGTCDKLTTTKDETIVLGIKDISEHIANLEELAKDDDQIKVRLSWLKSKAAILKVGANSESELSYISKKARDGVSAAYLALQDGVVDGGGVALYLIANSKLLQLSEHSVGAYILSLALQTPHKQILADGTVVSVDVQDPVLVVKNAIKNAISIAGTILTANAIVTLPEMDKIK